MVDLAYKKGPLEYTMRPKSRDVPCCKQQRNRPICGTDAAHLARFVPVWRAAALKFCAETVYPLRGKEDMNIELGKQYRTRDGREVRVYAVDGEESYPVHGAVKSPANGSWSISYWTSNGRACNSAIESRLDLIEVKPRIKTKAWLNVYRDEDGFEFNEVWESKHAADSARGDACIACVEIDIDVEESHGL